MSSSKYKRLEKRLAAASERALREIRQEKALVARQYAAAAASRSAATWNAHTSSANAELQMSLTTMRARARALMRDSSYAKRARKIVVNNVVGSGVGMQGQVKSTRKRLIKRVNSGIEEAFAFWSRAENCHTGGELHFHDLERQAIGQVFEAGEVFVRMHDMPMGESAIPFSLELIESERVPESIESAVGYVGANTRMGVEVDKFYRPQRYWIRDTHPSDMHYSPRDSMSDRVIPVPADEIIHLRIIDRWPQVRGVPWLHTAVMKLRDMDGYTEAEIMAARAAANYLGIIKGTDWEDPDIDVGELKDLVTTMEPGTFKRLLEGEEVDFLAPNRPNQALDPFLRYMLREVAAGVDVSYEALSRDYSQSNYSSSRLALLDDRDTWRTLQLWFIRSFRDRIHRRWLQRAVMARAVDGLNLETYMSDEKKFQAVKFKPRGWTWVDPQKEMAAAEAAVKAGFTTRTAVIAATAEGRDIEDVDEERAQELDSSRARGLQFTTDPVAIAQDGAATEATTAIDDATDDETSDDDDVDDDEASNESERQGRAVRLVT